MSFSTEFFAPLARTRPSSGPLGRTTIRSIRPSVCSLPPFLQSGDPSPIVATVLNSVVLDRAGLDKLLRPRMDVVTEQVGDGGDPGHRSRDRDRDRPLRGGHRAAADLRADRRGPAPPRRARSTSPSGATSSWPSRSGGSCSSPGTATSCAASTAGTSPRHPWWAPPDRVDARAARILGLLCTVSLVVGYLGTVVTQTITYATDGFGASDSAQGNLLAAVRVGVLLALVIVAMADRRGRRRLVLGATIASCATTALGALAPNMVVLGATQVVSRGLSMAVVMLITVIAAEEMPAGSRAYAVSVMTMTGALGAGMCLWALPLTGLGDNGWRLLYVIPLLGIPVTLWVARYLPESRRFARPHRDVAVLRGHGRRMALLGASFFLISSFGAPATQLMNDFLKDERGLLGVAHRAVHDADDHAGRHRARGRRADGRRAREAVDRGGRRRRRCRAHPRVVHELRLAHVGVEPLRDDPRRRRRTGPRHVRPRAVPHQRAGPGQRHHPDRCRWPAARSASCSPGACWTAAASRRRCGRC